MTGKNYRNYIENQNVDDNAKQVLDQLYDLQQRSLTTGRTTFSAFIDPATLRLCRSIFATPPAITCYGGYSAAEYQMIAFSESGHVSTDDFPIVTLCFDYNTRFGTIKHPHVLGSLLAVGIERKSIGDIVFGEGQFYVFVKTGMDAHIITEITKINRIGVKAKRVKQMANDVIIEDVTVKQLSVPSLRLDAVIAAGFTLSRTKASQYIKNAKVKCNYQLCDKVDYRVAIGDMISLRGHGRLYIDQHVGESKKAKTRLLVRITRR